LQYIFEWDPTKETTNIRKHKVSFRKAATVFHDPNQLSIYDETHSNYEERWITLGLDSDGVLRIVVHTFRHMNENMYKIRIISARKATSQEREQYQSKEGIK